LQQEQENTLSEMDEKLELMIEMLKNRKDTLAKAVKSHYKKQDLFLMEAKKNVERRKTNLVKVQNKVTKMQ
jgi:predicted HTH domain antitoxin